MRGVCENVTQAGWQIPRFSYSPLLVLKNVLTKFNSYFPTHRHQYPPAEGEMHWNVLVSTHFKTQRKAAPLYYLLLDTVFILQDRAGAEKHFCAGQEERMRDGFTIRATHIQYRANNTNKLSVL